MFQNPSPTGPDDKYIVVAGSRRGYPLKIDDPRVAPLRAVTFGSGKELWRLPVPQTSCYSRDCDGSGFFLDGRFYIGVESGWFYALDPLKTQTWTAQEAAGRSRPSSCCSATSAPRTTRATSCSSRRPSALGKNLYIASGAGHVYGLRRSDLAVVWDYFIGSDLDGTPVPTQQGAAPGAGREAVHQGQGRRCLPRPVQAGRQGDGLVLPDRRTARSGTGPAGSSAPPPSTTSTTATAAYPALCAFNAIDGYLYVVSQDTMSGSTVAGPEPRARA